MESFLRARVSETETRERTRTRTGSLASDDDGVRFLETENGDLEREKERRERMGVRFDPVTFVEHREALRDRESVR